MRLIDADEIALEAKQGIITKAFLKDTLNSL